MNSILSPSVAEKYFSQTIYHRTMKIETAIGDCETLNKANSIFLWIYLLSYPLINFRNCFDVLIGLNDLRKMNFNVNFQGNAIFDSHTEIRTQYKLETIKL